jgi:hypothetical protein
MDFIADINKITEIIQVYWTQQITIFQPLKFISSIVENVAEST